jgi:hypothetical protein
LEFVSLGGDAKLASLVTFEGSVEGVCEAAGPELVDGAALFFGLLLNWNFFFGSNLD